MILKVGYYNKIERGHMCECLDEPGMHPHCVDLSICGDLTGVPASALVGKIVAVYDLQPYISIGQYCQCINI